MAIVTNRTLGDSASIASFEVINNGADAEAATTIIDAANLIGAGDDDNQEVIVTRVVASVATTDMGDPALVTLSWGDGTDFLHLGPGASDIKVAFRTPNPGGTPDNDVTVTSAANVVFTLRVFAKKRIGFPLSMGAAGNRP